MGRWNIEMGRGILTCSRRARLRLQSSSTDTPLEVALRAFIKAVETRIMYHIAIVL